MEASQPSRFFLEPTQTFQRRYEALRAVFVEAQPLDRVAERFGYRLSALRSMVSRFRTDCRRGITPPFSRRRAGATSRSGLPPRPTPPRTCRSRGLPRAEPRARSLAPLARRGPLPLRPAAVPARFRSPRHRGRLSRLGDGPRPECVAGAPGVEAARQGAPQSHRRFQLRRGPRPLRRPQRPAQEVVRDRLFLPNRACPATEPVARLGQGPRSGDVPRGRGILARLPPDPLPRRSCRARPPLPAASWQGRAERADLLRPGTDEPLPLLRQRQPHPCRSRRRIDALRGVLAWGRRLRPQVALL